MDIGIIGSGHVGSALAGRLIERILGVDDVSAKAKVLRLIDALGFDGINAGTLADSWRQQPDCLAIVQTERSANGSYKELPFWAIRRTSQASAVLV